MEIDLLVEGVTDEIVLRQALGALGHNVGVVYGKRGIAYLRNRASGIAVRGGFGYRVVIVADSMDFAGSPCPGASSESLVTSPPAGTLVRLAVREIESWILGSRGELARFLRVPVGRIPMLSDEIGDPKQALVNLARLSATKRLREMMVPREHVSSVVGTGYVDAVSEFMNSRWNIDSASASSRSFRTFRERVVEKFG